MTTIDILRRFKNQIGARIDKKPSWGKIELRSEIERVYQETLEDLISPQMRENFPDSVKQLIEERSIDKIS